MFSAANSQLSIASSGNSCGIGSSHALSSPTLSSVSDTFSSIGSWTAGQNGETEDREWCLEEEQGKPRRGRKRRRRKSQQGVGGAAESWGGGVKKRKDDREKERVRNVRDRYEQLSAALGDLVESGRFSKVRILGTAVHRVEKLLEEVGGSVSQPAERICVILQTAGGRSEVPCEDTPSSPPLPNLSCMEPELHPYPTPSTSVDTLFPEEITPGYPSTPEDVLPTYSTAPYFSYSPAAEFPPMLGSSCLFPGNSPGPTLAPPYSLHHFSPEMVPHQVGGVIPTSTGDGPSSSGRGHSHVDGGDVANGHVTPAPAPMPEWL